MRSLEETLLLVPGFVIGFALHEFAHALAADKLGDPTPRQQGRLTIEPWPHIDIFGFITLLIAGFGWAKPVQIDPRNFKNPRRDDIIVSLAGPLTNLFLAVTFGFITFLLFQLNVFGSVSEQALRIIQGILVNAIFINVILFIFNLLPIPPLDGSHVIASMLPREQAYKYMSLQLYGMLFILFLAFFTETLRYIVFEPAVQITKLILGLFGLPL